jgi:hypothetical protein
MRKPKGPIKGLNLGDEMKKRLLSTLLAVTAGLVLACGQASANPDSINGTSGLTSPALLSLISSDDTFATMDLSTLADPPGTATPTQHYGPYASGSPDSGTCGNNWAEDTFDRVFTVRTSNDGTISVVEQFKNGSFLTNEGASPGSCDPTDGTGPGSLAAGVTGSMHGYFIVSNVANQTSNSPFCDATAGTDAGCTTTSFINTHFTPCYPVTCTVSTFFDHYSAGDQTLAQHEWKNASCDRGGNHGDIANLTIGPAPPQTPCVE